ncbi:glycosyltransferase family 2 protein [Thermodesulfobacteriota bacterium]
MSAPTITELPPPPSGKCGWPWTEGSPQLRAVMPNGSAWPKISIITPSLNQGQFIEETIRSVLLQGYPNLEYSIIDGGSTDGSVDLIKKYKQWLSYWVSEQDRGQSHAINKGIKRSTGDIVAWLNSDDIYEPSCFSIVSEEMFSKNLLKDTILFGDCNFISRSGEYLFKNPDEVFSRRKLIEYWRGYYIPQPSVFIPGHIFRDNLLNEDINYVMDWDLWLRLSQNYKYHHLNTSLSNFRVHNASKWGKEKEHFFLEHKRFVHLHHKNYLFKLQFQLSYVLWKLRKFYHNVIRKLFLKSLLFFMGDDRYQRLKYRKKNIFPYLSKKK